MSLEIYDGVGDENSFSVSRMYSNPLLVNFDGRIGGVIEKRLYIRNSDATYKYSSVTVEPGLDIPSDYDILGESGDSGFSFKVAEGDEKPDWDEWNTVQGGNSVSFSSDIEDTATYLPFWVRVEVPAQTPATQFSNVSLTIKATQELA